MCRLASTPIAAARGEAITAPPGGMLTAAVWLAFKTRIGAKAVGAYLTRAAGKALAIRTRALVAWCAGTPESAASAPSPE